MKQGADPGISEKGSRYCTMLDCTLWKHKLHIKKSGNFREGVYKMEEDDMVRDQSLVTGRGSTRGGRRHGKGRHQNSPQ